MGWLRIPVRQDSQDGEKTWESLNLVNDDESLKILKREHGIRESGGIFRIFGIKEEDRFTPLLGQHAGQGGLAHLARANDTDYTVPPDQFVEYGEFLFSFNHDMKLH
jgi:hypothetical protein